MRSHELLNVLCHVSSDAEWDGGDILTLNDGSIVSLRESAKTMRPGESKLMPPLFARRHHKHHRRHKHHCHEAAAPIVLVVSSIDINQKEGFMKVTLTWTTPKFRADGKTPLTLGEIQSTNVIRNGTNIATVKAVDSSLPLGNSFVDNTPLTGADAYTVDTVTTDGFVSADSNQVDIIIAAANPAAAVTDLTGVVSA